MHEAFQDLGNKTVTNLALLNRILKGLSMFERQKILFEEHKVRAAVENGVALIGDNHVHGFEKILVMSVMQQFHALWQERGRLAAQTGERAAPGGVSVFLEIEDFGVDDPAVWAQLDFTERSFMLAYRERKFTYFLREIAVDEQLLLGNWALKESIIRKYMASRDLLDIRGIQYTGLVLYGVRCGALFHMMKDDHEHARLALQLARDPMAVLFGNADVIRTNDVMAGRVRAVAGDDPSGVLIMVGANHLRAGFCGGVGNTLQAKLAANNVEIFDLPQAYAAILQDPNGLALTAPPR